MTILHDSTADLVWSGDECAIARAQFIPDWFLADLADERVATANARLGDHVRVASVPVAVVEKWLREGFDIYRESAAAIVARLRAENLTAFLATNRSI